MWILKRNIWIEHFLCQADENIVFLLFRAKIGYVHSRTIDNENDFTYSNADVTGKFDYMKSRLRMKTGGNTKQ